MITLPVPTPPTRVDPSTFAARADDFLSWLATTFVTELNSTAAALNLASTNLSSTSSVLIGVGDKSFDVSSTNSYQLGMWVIAADAAAPATNYVIGQVKTATTVALVTTLVIAVAALKGSGTITNWRLSMCPASGATLAANLFTGSQTEAEGAAVASAATTNIWATDGDTRHVTGTTNITGFGTAPQAGAWMKLVFDGSLTLTQSAALNLNNGGSDIIVNADDVAFVYADTTTQFDVFVLRKSGLPIRSLPRVESIDYSMAANALTLKLNPTTLEFRSTTATNGVPVTVSNPTQISTVISSGSTGGTTSAFESTIEYLAINNAGVMELAWGNSAYVATLSETDLITTVAEGGAGAADSGTTIYSTTARTGVAFRRVGSLRSTQTVAGTWAQTPTQLIPAGLRTAPGPLAMVGRVTSHQVITSGTVTKVQLNGELYDTDGAFDSTTNYRFQPKLAGFYRVSFSIGTDSSVTVTRSLAMLYKTGTEAVRGTDFAGAGPTLVGGSGLVYLNGTTDYLELYAYIAAATASVDLNPVYTYMHVNYERP